ncbi:hypothetical protein C7212DRAFT_334531 [Tuber magnatum]|uniref:Uncharacterized protein n=1 Tax=Tuber magnatum TaxID=42249 RepID=A0A317SE56_9PEZI|nr:hypothetical protein C7212DRAFT_334531 [Tuber magnatum]
MAPPKGRCCNYPYFRPDSPRALARSCSVYCKLVSLLLLLLLLSPKGGLAAIPI